MAVISAAKPLFAPKVANPGTTGPIYETPQAVGKLIGIEVKPQYKSGTLYADDSIAEEKKVFNYADVILNTSTLPFAVAAKMFGWQQANPKMGDEITESIYDENKEGAFGYVYGQVVDGATTYVAVFLPKVKFDVPEEKYETQGENINFQTPTINGKAYANTAGDWRLKEQFAEINQALTYLEGKFVNYKTMGNGTGETIPADPDEPTDPEATDPETTT
jgi:phi13 family phage major tail protein